MDVFKIPLGIAEALWHISRFKPDVIFSKGGYVAIPVIAAGRLLGKKIIIHESDFTPGMATKISSVFADKICVATGKTKECFSKSIQKKVVVTGNPVRAEILKGSKKNAFKLLKIKELKIPVLLVMGGSTGAMGLNEIIWRNLPELVKKFVVIHLTGPNKGLLNKGNNPSTKSKRIGKYFEFEYVGSELKDVYAITDIVICRSGAGTVSEVNALGLPAVYIPLPGGASRGDQLENAKYMSTTPSIVLDESYLNDKNGDKKFLKSLNDLYQKNRHKKKVAKDCLNAAKKIVQQISA